MSVVVIDNGSSLTRAGFSGDYRPASVFPTIVGQLKCENDEIKYFIGNDIENHTEDSVVWKYPVDCGLVMNYEHIEKVC